MSFDPIPCTFSGMPFDRADAKRQDPAWLAAQRADPATRFLPLHDLKPAVGEGARLAWHGGPVKAAEMVLLGLDDAGVAHFAYAAAQEDLPPGSDWIEMRAMAMHRCATGQADRETAIAGLGRSLLAWHARHRFCSNCGAPTAVHRGGYARLCAACKGEHFPRVDPVVIMMVVRGDHCVLGRQSGFPPGMYSALAGFMEPGESVEEAVRREVLEEVGLRVGEVRYVCSQPWPFPSNLMLGCFADALDQEIIVDPAELEAADWFSRDELAAALSGAMGRFRPAMPSAIAHQLMKHWIA